MRTRRGCILAQKYISLRAGPRQGGSPKDCLARGVDVLFAQESCAQVRSRNRRVDDGIFLLRKGIPGLIADLGARKARMGGFGSDLSDPRSGSPD